MVVSSGCLSSHSFRWVSCRLHLHTFAQSPLAEVRHSGMAMNYCVTVAAIRNEENPFGDEILSFCRDWTAWKVYSTTGQNLRVMTTVCRRRRRRISGRRSSEILQSIVLALPRVDDTVNEGYKPPGNVFRDAQSTEHERYDRVSFLRASKLISTTIIAGYNTADSVDLKCHEHAATTRTRPTH